MDLCFPDTVDCAAPPLLLLNKGRARGLNDALSLPGLCSPSPLGRFTGEGLRQLHTRTGGQTALRWFCAQALEMSTLHSFGTSVMMGSVK